MKKKVELAKSGHLLTKRRAFTFLNEQAEIFLSQKINILQVNQFLVSRCVNHFSIVKCFQEK